MNIVKFDDFPTVQGEDKTYDICEWLKFMVNVGTYSIHGASMIEILLANRSTYHPITHLLYFYMLVNG